MAVKTITIDLAAYEALARQKRPGESFSDVIKAHFGGRKTAADLLRAFETIEPPSEEALEHIEEQIRRRRKSIARAVKL